MKKLFRRLVALCVATSLVFGTAPSFAFAGNVIYSPTTGDMITRTRSFPAKTPELDITYQRTMRTAATRAAIAGAVRNSLRTFIEKLPVIGAIAVLASDLYGIWKKKDDGTNDLMLPQKTAACIATAPNCVLNPTATRTYKVVDVNGGCAYAAYDKYSPTGDSYFAGNFCYGTYGSTLGELKSVADAELEDLVKADNPLIPILKQFDSLGQPVPFPDPEVEEMPKPIAIQPTTVVKPDGSKTITQTTLEPYRDPVDESIKWKKKDVVTEISKPDATGNTTTTTETTTTDKGQSSTPEKPPEAPATDTALPLQPKLYKQKYPEGITGVWQTQRDAMANSPLFTIAKTLMPAVGLSGSCPTMPVNLNFSQWANFGTRDVAPPCQVWDWGRAICMVSACLLARRLIFGG